MGEVNSNSAELQETEEEAIRHYSLLRVWVKPLLQYIPLLLPSLLIML